MEEQEFRRLLELFPSVRSPDYNVQKWTKRDEELKAEVKIEMVAHIRDSPNICDVKLELDESSQSTSQSKQKEEVKQLQDAQSTGGIESNTRAMDHGEAFWGKLKAAAEKKMNPAEAEGFCKAFRQVYRKLVDEELSLEAARSLLNS